MAAAAAVADPAFQQVCLKMLADMTLSFFGSPSAADTLFFLKGGNAATIHLHGGPPYPFKSDFDMTALIDPATYSDERFISIVEVALSAVFYSIRNAMPNFGPRVPSPDFDVGGMYGDVTIMLKDVSNNPMWQQFGGQSPFLVTLMPYLSYEGAGSGITLIKVQTKTEPRLDIIDIAIPRKEYTHYKMEWEMAMGDVMFYNMGELRRGNVRIPYGFWIGDVVFTYFDQRIAAGLNSRPAKRSARTERADALEELIRQNLSEYAESLKKMTAVVDKYTLTPKTTGGYRPTKRNLTYLSKWRKGKSIGFTMRSSLKAKGLIPRSNGTYKVSAKYRRRRRR